MERFWLMIALLNKLQVHKPNTLRKTLIQQFTMRILTILILLNFICVNSKSQGLTWGDIYDCDFSTGIIEPNKEINCANFFQLKDSCTLDALIMWNWTSEPGIRNLDSALNVISYPKAAERFKISGSIFIRVLIDKNGSVYCYQLLSELGDSFNQEAEHLLTLLKFNVASISNRKVAYVYSFPVSFKHDINRKK